MFDIFTTTATNFKNDMDNLLVDLKPYEVTYQLDGQVMSLIFHSKKEMALTMMRMAEYYESPHSHIKGKYFTHEQLIDAYSDDDGNFTYMNFYEGYNLPFIAIQRFKRDAEEFTARETDIIKLFSASNAKYLITTLEGDTNTLDHELAHARWAIDSEYKQQMLKIICSIPKNTYAFLQYDLMAHYDADVLDDELQAYMITATIEELEEMFPSFPTEELIDLQKLFV